MNRSIKSGLHSQFRFIAFSTNSFIPCYPALVTSPFYFQMMIGNAKTRDYPPVGEVRQTKEFFRVEQRFEFSIV